MDFWDILSYAAWIVSAILLIWLIVDTFKVSKEYSEDYLLSSREGEDIIPEDDNNG